MTQDTQLLSLLHTMVKGIPGKENGSEEPGPPRSLLEPGKVALVTTFPPETSNAAAKKEGTPRKRRGKTIGKAERGGTTTYMINQILGELYAVTFLTLSPTKREHSVVWKEGGQEGKAPST